MRAHQLLWSRDTRRVPILRARSCRRSVAILFSGHSSPALFLRTFAAAERARGRSPPFSERAWHVIDSSTRDLGKRTSSLGTVSFIVSRSPTPLHPIGFSSMRAYCIIAGLPLALLLATSAARAQQPAGAPRVQARRGHDPGARRRASADRDSHPGGPERPAADSVPPHAVRRARRGADRRCRRSLKELAQDGYIFVIQNLRGRFKSEGTFKLSSQVDLADSEGDQRDHRRLRHHRLAGARTCRTTTARSACSACRTTA